MRPQTMYYFLSAVMAVGMGTTCVAYGPFMSSLGLSYAEFSLINFVFWTVVICSELPTGALADGRSRSWSIAMAGVFFGLGAAVYFCASGLWTAMLAEVLVGVGGAFMSGAKQSWMVDSLKKQGLADEALKRATKKTFGMDKIVHGSILLVFGVFGNWLAHHVGFNFIWLPLILSGVFTWWFATYRMNGHGEPDEKISEWEALKRSFALLKCSRSLIWVAGTLIVFGLVVSFNHFWSVYFNELFGPASSSWVWLIMYPSVPIAGFLVRSRHILDGREEPGILAALLASGFGLALIPMMSDGLAFALPAVVIHEIGRGMFEPLTDSFIHHRVDSSFRATFSSLQSLVGRLGFAISPLVVWFCLRGEPSNSASVAIVWMISGGFMVVGALVLYLLRPRESLSSTSE
ncbi:MAG: Major facilitator superfamily [Candidatus Uhrbacteria bacterium GW2011_GWF2_44_350]|uniref:Major facilitator superfamily n=1 Tax=Candidatus Uhrbacteria bacterium GW2011_GWF2_44_350 TaxID=1619000 RepID=A0A0G1JEX7_9BACT|nr:MAG: Major facilitator superfamily [Candidatus Uhrbacteria bacterium GW2011_GWF2_44_350]